MSSDTVIQVSNLSKRYRLGVIGTGTLSHDLNRWWAKVRGKPDPTLKIGAAGTGRLENGDDSEFVWALRDVSFEVKRGEVLGIIGTNGAGKSTLLKILSRVTAPTSGEVRLRGRVASLLEVGTGFHPELTGRENVFLNGAILGMSKQQTRQRLDEIVEFAELSKYIDTPVKRYSSGMYVRLAFAVAAHLESEILIVDEVLAVGDISFQKKCLGKMGSAATSGRTVLFVSHNMVAVQSLCRCCLLLEAGTIRFQGATARAIGLYREEALQKGPEHAWRDADTAPGNEVVRIAGVSVAPETCGSGSLITMETPFSIVTEYWVRRTGANVALTFHMLNEQGIIVLTTGSDSMVHENGRYCGVCRLPGGLLNSGSYSLKLLTVEDGSRVTYRIEELASFQVIDDRERNGGWMGREPGVVQPILTWQTEKLPD